jgi:hypothetical protein
LRVLNPEPDEGIPDNCQGQSWDGQNWHGLVEREAARIKHEQSPAECARIEYYGRLLDNSISFDAVYARINARRPTPDTVLEAILVSVVERGLGALNEAKNINRAARLNDAQMTELRRRIRKLIKQKRVGIGLAPPDPSTRRLAAELENDPAFQKIWRPAVDKFHGRILKKE